MFFLQPRFMFTWAGPSVHQCSDGVMWPPLTARVHGGLVYQRMQWTVRRSADQLTLRSSGRSGLLLTGSSQQSVATLIGVSVQRQRSSRTLDSISILIYFSAAKNADRKEVVQGRSTTSNPKKLLPLGHKRLLLGWRERSEAGAACQRDVTLT